MDCLLISLCVLCTLAFMIPGYHRIFILDSVWMFLLSCGAFSSYQANSDIWQERSLDSLTWQSCGVHCDLATRIETAHHLLFQVHKKTQTCDRSATCGPRGALKCLYGKLKLMSSLLAPLLVILEVPGVHRVLSHSHIDAFGPLQRPPQKCHVSQPALAYRPIRQDCLHVDRVECENIYVCELHLSCVFHHSIHILHVSSRRAKR